MKLLKLIVLILSFIAIPYSYALTVGEIGGDYTADYFAFNGSVAPQVIPIKIVLQPTGIWAVMCKQTYGANTYEYPCYSDVWHLDGNNGINLSSLIMCEALNTDTLFCYINNNPAGLVMLRNRSYLLNVTKVGNGSGSISSSSGISCGGTVTSINVPFIITSGASGTICSQALTPNAVITLVAAPDNGSIFNGWSGCDNLNGNTCTTLMTSDKTVTATFTKQSFLLTVVNANPTQGVVIASVGKINCGSTCSDSYEYGQTIMLTVYPASGYKISSSYGWTCDNVNNVCHETININSNTTINVDFKLIQ